MLDGNTNAIKTEKLFQILISEVAVVRMIQ